MTLCAALTIDVQQPQVYIDGMAWSIRIGSDTVTSTDGLTSMLTREVDAWVASAGGRVIVDNVTMAYNATDEAQVLAATLGYVADELGTTATVVVATTHALSV